MHKKVVAQHYQKYCVFYCIIEYLILSGAHSNEFLKNFQKGAKDGFIIEAIGSIIMAIHLLTCLNSRLILQYA